MGEQHGNPAPILQYAGPRRDPSAPEVLAQGTEFLVVRHGAALPNRCIICNGAPDGAPKRVRLRWVAREARESQGSPLKGGGILRLIVWLNDSFGCCASFSRRYASVSMVIVFVAIISPLKSSIHILSDATGELDSTTRYLIQPIAFVGETFSPL